jgi:hypothetical protein
MAGKKEIIFRVIGDQFRKVQAANRSYENTDFEGRNTTMLRPSQSNNWIPYKQLPNFIEVITTIEIYFRNLLPYLAQGNKGSLHTIHLLYVCLRRVYTPADLSR